MRISDWSSDVCSSDLGQPELADDPRFSDIGARTENCEELYDIAGGFIAMRSTQAWLDTCERLSIPAAPMLTLEMRLEERRVGKECVSTFRSWWSAYH